MLIGANQKTFECWTRAVATVTEEMSQFLQTRVQEGLGMWSKLATCKDMGQVLECQYEFAQKAATDYLDEARKLSQLTMTLASDNLAALKVSSSEGERAAA